MVKQCFDMSPGKLHIYGSDAIQLVVLVLHLRIQRVFAKAPLRHSAVLAGRRRPVLSLAVGAPESDESGDWGGTMDTFYYN